MGVAKRGSPVSLVTRCPECSSAFRVLPAQLSARGGRVRCGKCGKVFNGVIHLVQDPQRPEPDEPSPQIGLFEPRKWPAAAPSATSDRSERGGADAGTPGGTPPQVDAAAPAVPMAPAVSVVPTVSVVPAVSAVPVAPRVPVMPVAAPVSAAPEAMDAAYTALAARADAQALPEFLAERPVPREFRLVWGLLSLIAIAVLAGQTVFHFRTEVAALFPEARPHLEIACEMLECELRLPRRAELLSIESSDLQADSSRANVLVLNAVLRNRAPFPQEFPSLELTLNNERDEAVVRRVLSPTDYLAGRRAAPGGIAPGAEESLRLYLEAAKVRATGYRLYLFFP